MTARPIFAKLGLSVIAALSLAIPNSATAEDRDASLAKSVRKVDYAKDVAAILQAKCQNCHRPNQAAPFSLLTYQQAKRWSATIAEAVEEDRMPPWHAAEGHLAFSNDRSLTSEQKEILLAWVEQDCPSGDLAQAPANPEFPSDWKIGKPDAVFTLPKPMKVKADGTMPYQWVRIPTNFAEDKWIQAAEIRPSDRRVVHHVLVFVSSQGASRPRDGLNPRTQLCGYAPGDVPAIFPDGAAKKIPANSELWLQIHYTPIGKATEDQSSVGLVFADEKKVKAEVGTHGIFQTRFLIPPNADNHPVEKTFVVPVDVQLHNLWPHMHVRGKDFKFTAVYPDGKTEVLLDVPRYDFNWQTTYNLKQPKLLPKGTKIECVAHFDNSAGNSANPDPNQAVHWGDQTYDEMMIGYLDYTIDGPDALKLESLRRREPVAGANGDQAQTRANANNPVRDRVLRFLRDRRERVQNSAKGPQSSDLKSN